jgi:beta-mannosidase
MKRPLLLLIAFMSSIIATHTARATPVKLEINTGWRFKQARLANWHPATVPGVVHTDLLANKIIDDPFFRLNERGAQWVDKEDWVYETTFEAGAPLLEKRNISLFFEGLDTYADVFLNDEKILSADNMFREWRAGVKHILKPGKNTLRVYFHSPVKIDMPKWEALPFHYRAINDQSENGGLLDRKLSVFARKAGYHYGWDWGPRLVTSGIWRPVWLEAWDDARIENVRVIQRGVTAASAHITAVVEVLADRDIAGATISIGATAAGENAAVCSAVAKTALKAGLNTITAGFVMKSPRLWWSNGLGEPHLYDFTTTLSSDGGGALDAKSEKIGVRSLRLVNEPDAIGRSFYFELNGVRVFAKGANYIPCDSFLPRVTRETYERTILDAVRANMNMLRVWGGGIYENGVFYDLCDRHGIMVWQDFMFACAVYPAGGGWLENARREAVDNVRRLRNHACLALWCGNNECIDAWYAWSWKKAYEEENPAHAKIIWGQMERQYYEVLPRVIAENDPDRFYWPSSPFSDKSGARDSTSGDMHFWEVWHRKRPVSDYNLEKSRFFSEYGFQSFPAFESVKRYAPDPEDWSVTSEAMMAHQRAGDLGNTLIESYLLAEYRKPRDFPSFLHMNNVLQGDAIKTAIEAHRRDMPSCMGSLYWQHNDCWPVASWSSRDYYGRWKAAHYFARKAFADVLVSPIEENGALRVSVVSDRLRPFAAELRVEIMTLDGKKTAAFSEAVTVPANTSALLFSRPLAELLGGKQKNEVIVHASLAETSPAGTRPSETPTAGGEAKIHGNAHDNVYDNVCFLVKQKDIAYPRAAIEKTIAPVGGGYKITLKSEVFARGVFMSDGDNASFFEDNYFDLLPGVPRVIPVRTPLPPEAFAKQFTVISLADDY